MPHASIGSEYSHADENQNKVSGLKKPVEKNAYKDGYGDRYNHCDSHGARPCDLYPPIFVFFLHYEGQGLLDSPNGVEKSLSKLHC